MKIDKITENIIMSGSQFEEERQYWLNKFKGNVTLSTLNYDYPEFNTKDNEKAINKCELSREILNKLNKLSSESYYMAYIILLACISIVLKKHCRSQEIIIGMPEFELRQKNDNFKNNILLIKSDLENEKSFRQLLVELKNTVSEADKHRKIPYPVIAKALNLIKDTDDSIRINTVVMLDNIHSRQSIEDVDTDIVFMFSMGDEELTLSVEYKPHLFKESTINRIIGHIIQVFNSALNDVGIKLSDIEVITKEEIQQILVEFNNTKTEYPKDKTIHQLFEEQVEKVPENIALVYEDKKLTYRELNERANQLARSLRKKGVVPDSIVGIMVERSIEMIVGIMGILKAGGAYLPIDPEYPKDRIEYMLEDSKITMLLTQKHLKNNVMFKGELIELDDQAIYIEAEENLEIINKANDLAYVIYTSGSTGKPKGVMVEHKSICNSIQWRREQYKFNKNDRILLLFSYAFDGFVTSFFTPIVSGSTTVLVRNGEEKDPIKINRYIKEMMITHFIAVPSLYTYILDCMEEKNNSLRVITLAGEKATPKIIEYSKRKLNNTQICNEYGPTENSVVTTIKEDIKNGQNVTIGKPIANTEIFILDNNFKLQPVGAAGELCISGAGLARGYLNRPDLEAEKFVSNPYKHNAKMYRTGDLGRWLSDGNIEFLGRIDYQVKIRGFRIELEEIENHLLVHEDIKEAAVVAKDDSEESKYLCAYIAAEKELKISELKEYLSKKLPDYMIPSYFIQLDKMPLTPNGKVDRKALPEPDGSIETGTEYEAPGNEIEEKLVEIWQEILQIEKIGVNDNFFDLGGHSLKATNMMLKMHKELGVEIYLADLFRKPTIKSLGEYIKLLDNSTCSIIESVEEKEYYPLSSAQKRLYIIDQIEGQSITYNVPYIVIIEGILNAGALEEAFSKIVKRHEALRTSFETVDGQAVQKIHDHIDFKIESIHLQDDDKEEDIIEGFIRPFDLSKAPLIRAGIVKRNENEHILMIDMHHIISDGTSIDILMKELSTFYIGKELDDLRVQYKDYSVWQNELHKDDKFKKHEKYWIEKFKGEIPVLNMPLDYQRPTKQSFEGDTIEFQIDNELTSKLRQLTKTTETTLYMVLLSAYTTLLYKYTDQEDIIVGSLVAGRSHADLQDMIGAFINTLAMRNYPRGEKTFVDYLQELKKDTLDSFENGDYPFEELVDKLSIKRDMSRNPLFDTLFTLQNMDMRELEIEGLKIKPYNIDSNISKFDITVTAIETNAGIDFIIGYCTKLFIRERIERMAGHFINLLRTIADNPRQKLCDIDILSKEERNILLNEFNNTKIEYPRDKTIHQLFEEQVEKTPDNIAAVYKNKQLTYRELNESANRLARVLREKGVGPDKVVGIMVERSLEMITGIMGILKAGGAYLPIDPEYPKDRIEYMLRDSSVNILLTQSKLSKKVEFNGTIIEINSKSIYTVENTNIEQINKPRDLAYIIYTSGTTGKPKGVMIENKSVVNFIKGITNVIKFEENKTILCLTTICFDIFGLETLLPLTEGMKVVIGGKEALQNDKLNEMIEKHKVTMLQATPSRMQIILQQEQGSKIISKLEEIMIGGEAVSESLLKEIQNKTKAKIYNMYGPTETTIWSSVIELTGKNKVVIGKPIANTSIYILDKSKALCPIGIAGELCIAGEGLSRGYLNRQELTAAKFIDNPFVKGEKIYKTGDLARWNSDGSIEFIGRIDNQVKINGFRIELSEIETGLMKNKEIKGSAVIDRVDENGNKYLCAYITGEKELDIMKVKEELKKTLPNYMIPSYIIQLEAMPLNPNGKTDKKALPHVNTNGNDCCEQPRNITELMISNIWSQLLRNDNIDINESFFDLGGNSLLAIKMIYEINKKLNISISIIDVFEYSSIKSLSGYIAKEHVSQERSAIYIDESIVLLKRGSKNGKNLFFIPDGTGDPSSFIQIVNKLSGDFNCWGIMYDLLKENSPQNIKIEEEAEIVLNKIKDIQNEEPYNLIAFCYGGYITCEIAKILEARNEQIDKVFFIEVIPPILKNNKLNELYDEWISFNTETEILYANENLKGLNYSTDVASKEEFWDKCISLNKEICDTSLNELKENIDIRFRISRNDFDTIGIEALLKHINVVRSTANAVTLYKKSYRQDILNTKLYFVQASENLTFGDEYKNWDNTFINNPKHFVIEGTHFGIMKDEGSKKIAGIIENVFKG